MSRSKSLTWAGIVLLLLVFAHCRERIQRPDQNYPIESELAEFPIFQQPDHISCGPTSLQMVLKYYGKPLLLNEIRQESKTDFYVRGDVKLGGTTPEYMEIALRHFGVPANTETCTIEKLKWYVSQGRPPIALVRSGDKFWHWVVVIGYTENTITLADPGGQKWSLDIKLFKTSWEFTTDLSGANVASPCPICRGKGKFWDGPFGMCDVCSGSGKFPDLWWLLIELGEMKGRIVIVPKEKAPLACGKRSLYPN